MIRAELTRESTTITGFSSLVKHYAKSQDSFYFIQVGANDGINGDPVYPHVIANGWHGILIEPQVRVFQDQLLRTYRNCKGLEFENVAISEEDGEREMFRISVSQKRWATGISSFRKSHLQGHIERGYIKRKASEGQALLPKSDDEYIDKEIVKTMSFKTLLDKYRPAKIDLLQIDAEGYDYELLKLWDFGRYLPTVIQFEHLHLTGNERADAMQLLENYFYSSFSEGLNTVAFQGPVPGASSITFEVSDLRLRSPRPPFPSAL
jgi:FkbM family methyltransferase